MRCHPRPRHDDEAALTKLMHVLAQTDDPVRIRELMTANLRGELTPHRAKPKGTVPPVRGLKELEPSFLTRTLFASPHHIGTFLLRESILG